MSLRSLLRSPDPQGPSSCSAPIPTGMSWGVGGRAGCVRSVLTVVEVGPTWPAISVQVCPGFVARLIALTACGEATRARLFLSFGAPGVAAMPGIE
eukprot:3236875-Pyramimonas_sp.AAC.1